MRILMHEMRKIWQPRIVAAIALLGVLFYLAFCRYSVEYFNPGPYHQAAFDLSAEWVEQFGPTLEPDERAQLDRQFDQAKEDFARSIAHMPEAKQLNIASYDDLQRFQNDLFADEDFIKKLEAGDEEARATLNLVSSIGSGTPELGTVQHFESYLESYDRYQEAESLAYRYDLQTLSDAKRNRLEELEGSAVSLLPGHVADSTARLASYFSVWVALSVILLLSPTLMRDRLHRVRQAQWAARCGRRITRTQFAAGLLSAAALTVANLAVYGILFFRQGQLAFAECPLYAPVQASTGMAALPWIDATYGHYLLILGALLLAFGMACGALALALSRFSDSYVGMLLKALPLFAVVGALSGPILFNMTFFDRPFYLGTLRIYLPPAIEGACVGALLAAGLALCFAICRRQRRSELLN